MIRLLYWVVSIIATITSFLVFALPVIPNIGDTSRIVGEGDFLIAVGILIFLISIFLLVGLSSKNIRFIVLNGPTRKYGYLSALVLCAYVIGISCYIVLVLSSRL